ncbi:Wrky transcription factor wrky24 [Thalictrum thalictroides]|uniref:Wrky transcription factor wrky24 n=1 Tax=Thalictrum thalictroides TaxID=46969 RepID=A0A7J6VTD4_THATH|nr:Wrky transcription factor wrky24 [Thalictrum thalictroides]
MAENDGTSRTKVPSSRPTISLPPRTSAEYIFTGGAGASPGPMTLVSNFFSENDPDSEFRSFSQLLAGAMGSPVALMNRRTILKEDEKEFGDGDEKEYGLKQHRPLSLVVAAQSNNMFTVPSGLSPASLLESPSFFSPVQGHFGMSHQQALAQVTAQAAQLQSQFHMPSEYSSSILAPPATSLDQQPSFGTAPSQMPAPRTTLVESSVVSYSEQRSQPPPLIVDKPAEDGYNWRKYGQKQVKGSEFPRSYYKCTHPNCPVKKKVERSLDGHVTEIIYKGQHNHEPPQHIKRAKDGGNSNGRSNLAVNAEMGGVQDHSGNLGRSNETAAAVSKSTRDQELCQATQEQLSGSSDGEEVGDAETRVDAEDEDQPEPKRKNTGVRVSEPASSHRAVTEPRIIVQTTSEVDLLDDGYRWRKYGQKVVKGNPHPRSYYKCTSTGCNVRKHVERASTDAKAVITTYEGKHNHDVPAAKNSSHNTAHSNLSQIKPQNAVGVKHSLINKKMDFGGSDQQAVALLRFKEEQVT